MAQDSFRRRDVLSAAAVGTVMGATTISPVQAQPRSGKTFVLVHGAWHGGWCWRRVTDILSARGHTVFTPTMTGVGERAHLANPNIDLDAQITDIVNMMKWEDVRNVVLCGHSYGGCVVSGVAEQLESAIASIIFLDAFMPENGQALVDMTAPAQADVYKKMADAGTLMPPIPAAAFNVNEKDRAWVDSKCTPHPAKCFTQKLTLTGARERIAKKSYILASGWKGPFNPFYEKRKGAAGWRTYEVACGHDVMVDMPGRLAEILEEVA